jgi:hypothetical protein
MTGKLVARWFLAIVAASGFAGSILVYVQSFRGATMSSIILLLTVLGTGVVALTVVMYVAEYPSSTQRGFWLGGFARGIPAQSARWAMIAFWLVVFGHFLWFAVKNDFGVPDFSAGQYALVDRGRIVKVLSEVEYQHAQSESLRVLAICLIECYATTA